MRYYDDDSFIEAPEPEPMHVKDSTPERDAAALIAVMEMARQAVTAETPKCFSCKNAIFYYEWYKSLTPGHCYSQAGIREVRMSGMCEHCFDEMADEMDPEGIPESRG